MKDQFANKMPITMARPSMLNSRSLARCSDVGRIILVDGDKASRSALAADLREDGHVVVEFATSAELRSPEQFAQAAIVITDYEMPTENGLHFAKRLNAVSPALPVVIVTNDPQRQLEREVNATGFISLCRKPLDYPNFHELVDRIIEGDPGRCLAPTSSCDDECCQARLAPSDEK
jgi:DNA-binding NtrC family response regulator